MTKFEKGDARAKSGRARSMAIAAETKAQIEHNVAAMLAGLGREPTQTDRMDAEAACSLLLRARRLRDQGQDDSKLLLQYGRLMRDSAFRSPHAAATEQRQD